MNSKRLLKQTFGLILAILLLTGCGEVPTGPVTTSTPVPQAATPTSVPPTPTPVLPTPTPIPAAGIGVPVASGGWQVIVEGTRQEAALTRSEISIVGGQLSFGTTTYYPGDGYTFLIVETTFHNFDPTQRTEVPAKDVTLIRENGESYDADDLSEPPDEFVFRIEENAINQGFELHFRDAPPISFSVEQEASHVFATEIGVGLGLLPYVCKAESLPTLGEAGQLTFHRQTETGLVLGYIDPDGSDSTQVCSDIAAGNLHLAPDGATLLLVAPHQGWSNLYLIETNGEVYILETNGLNIEARFDPSGRWVLFATERVGEAGKELYIFDRETTSTDLVQAGDRVAFDFLTDGRLIIDYRETEDSDRQYYVGVTDGSALELLDISDDIPGNRSVSADGQHLVYRDIDSSFGLHLVIADLDGSNAKELAQGYRSRLDGLFSPDSQSILLSVIGIGEENDAANTVMLHNLTTDETRPIAEGSHYLDLGFSDDSQWAFVLSTISASSTGAEEQRTLYVVRTADGGVREIDDAVSAFFSPDSTQLAYTVRGLDGNPEMYVTSLEDESVQSLGPGVVMGWFPVGVAP